MKKLLLAAAFTLAALGATAQTVTKESIQGKWEPFYAEFNGVVIDFENKTYSLAPEITASLTPAELKEMENELQRIANGGLDEEGDIEITQDTMVQHEDGQVVKMPYTLIEASPAIMELIVADGTKKAVELSFKDGNLIFFEPIGRSKLSYKKQNKP